MAWVEHRTGVRAAFGGAHPGRGTRNALLALGPSCYLEILAPDPQQGSPAWFTQVSNLRDPRLLAWAVHTPDLVTLAQAAVEACFPIDGPHEGTRSRPDGKNLRWKLFRLRDDHGGMLPFFIEWSRDSRHPAVDAPPGCHLERFQLQSPNAAELARTCQALSVEVPVDTAEKPRMLARLATPKGEVELTS